MSSNIGKIMKTRRIELGLKVKDLALDLGVAESTYREWEHGRKIQGEPYLDISNNLKLPITQLLGIETPNMNELNQDLRDLENSVKNLRKSFFKIL